MKRFAILLLMCLPIMSLGQAEITELTWEDLKIEEFGEKEVIGGLEYAKPVFTDEQVSLDGKNVMLSGNFHVLNNFGSKTYLLSSEEIIKTPMNGDEVIRLLIDKDPEIFYGKTIQITGLLHIERDIEAETIYYITDVDICLLYTSDAADD